ncbi:MAG: hypothetical protein IAF94_19705 [Pirellulaceae bacterium]|nr:hypothetical protein [Pirellulaceae bacterium]
MNVIHGTYKSGHVELDTPVDWPEGVRVEILSPSSRSKSCEDCGDFGMDERDWPTTKEGIEELIARMDAREPVEYTAEDLKRIEEANKWIGDYTRAAVARDMGLEP